MDEDDAEYVCMNVTESTKNHQGSSKDYESNDVRMYGDGVKYFKQYISKLHPECQRLFQYGGRKSESCWFDNKPVGKNAMAIIMQTISKSAVLSTVYTCHSVRASTITHFYRAGVPVEKIQKITQHKNPSSLKAYVDDLSTTQKKDVCKVMDNMLALPETVSSIIIHQQNSV